MIGNINRYPNLLISIYCIDMNFRFENNYNITKWQVAIND